MHELKVAIIGAGNLGLEGIDYDEFSRTLSRALESVGIDVVILGKVPSDIDLLEEYSAFIFITRGMLDDAKAFKEVFPKKKVILFSGIIEEGDDKHGIIPIRKGASGSLEKIVEIIKS